MEENAFGPKETHFGYSATSFSQVDLSLLHQVTTVAQFNAILRAISFRAHRRSFFPPIQRHDPPILGEEEEESHVGHGSLDVSRLLVPIIQILGDPITPQTLHNCGRQEDLAGDGLVATSGVSHSDARNCSNLYGIHTNLEACEEISSNNNGFPGPLVVCNNFSNNRHNQIWNQHRQAHFGFANATIPPASIPNLKMVQRSQAPQPHLKAGKVGKSPLAVG